MKCLQLLFVWCCCSVFTVTICITVDGYSCVSAYWDSVTCVLNITGYTAGRSNATYSLKFTDNGPCPLVETNHSHSCVCKVTKQNRSLSSYDKYDIQLCVGSNCHLVTKGFRPSKNIQPTPPHEATVEGTAGTFNITWKSGYEGHRYLANVLDYELLLQTPQGAASQARRLNSQQTSVSIPRSQLQPSATYCIKVRSKTNIQSYKGTWSKWSPSTCWRNGKGGEEEDEGDNILVILIKSLGPVCVAVGVMLFLLLSPAVRLRIKTLSDTPSPAPFFRPLFQQHEGNLQEWLSPQRKLLLTYKPEEILITDAVIVVPKPVTKDPEENQDFHNPTVHLAFTQCQTPYVVLPGIQDASPPLTMACPGDMSYTPLPFSIWDVDIEEADVVSTTSKDFLDISRTDSGCRCEDLSQSSDCSTPNSPVDECPTPHYCNDYCILNKTAEGFAPVLVSKGSGLKVPDGSLQESES